MFPILPIHFLYTSYIFPIYFPYTSYIFCFIFLFADDGDVNYDWLIFDFTKPYALVSVVDRNITIRQFDTLEKAQEKMKKEFQKCPDWKEWKKDFKPKEETYEYGFYNTSAWANADDGDMEYDWFIIAKSWFS